MYLLKIAIASKRDVVHLVSKIKRNILVSQGKCNEQKINRSDVYYKLDFTCASAYFNIFTCASYSCNNVLKSDLTIEMNSTDEVTILYT